MAPLSLFFVATCLVVSVSCHPQYGSQQTQQQTVGDSTSSQNICPYANDCVPHFQCVDGFINTDGSGLIDVRVRPQATCINADYPDVPALCCEIPGFITTAAPLTTCYGIDECVDPYLCSAEGEIITDGGGLIDIRIKPTKCYLSPDSIGVCCSPPKPPILEFCPEKSFCAANDQCLGQGLTRANEFIDYISTGLWQECSLPYNNVGLCCNLPILDTCDLDSACVPQSQCSGTAQNSVNSFVDYVQEGLWRECTGNGYIGVCCNQPILEYCNVDSVCVPHGQCSGTAQNSINSFIRYAQDGSWRECAGNGFSGVCCNQPILEFCESNSVCVPHGQCSGTAQNSINSFIDYIQEGSWRECVGNGFNGVCCNQPILEFCESNSVCVPHGQCSGTAQNSINSFVDYIQEGSWRECVGNGFNGVCCNQPILEFCESNSVCVPHGQCSGTAQNSINSFVDYIEVGSWRECVGNGFNGVCCNQPILEFCESNSVCVPHGQCSGTAQNSINSFIDYIQDGSWRECAGNGFNGVCCIHPILNQCHIDSVCVEEGQCLGKALDSQNAFVDYTQGSGWRQCLGSNYNGVCCKQPIKELDYCPTDSVCVAYGKCAGTARNNEGSFVPYDVFNSYSECSLGAGLTETGVCCISDKSPPLPIAEKCGIRNYHIDQRIQSNYGQNEAAFGEFPWQGIIFTTSETAGKTDFVFKCGASLISERFVITAAHCVDKISADKVSLRFGEWQVNDFNEPLPYKDIKVLTITVHPQFNSKNVHNDIAVLELIEPITLYFHINTICLPGAGEVFLDQQDCITTGWGKDSFEGQFQHILKKVNLPFVDHYKCQSLLQKTRLGKYFKLDDSFLCAGGIANEDACYGDGGGPLVCKNPATGQYVLAGITAWGIGCGQQDVPGVYADVRKFHSWVNNIILNKNSHQQQAQIPAINYRK